jgi:hypothetical protein
MSRIVWVSSIVFLACLGCGAKKETAAPAVESTPTPQSPVTPAAPTVVTPTPASPAPDPTLTRLRELLADYLASDGQGGWRKDEKAATELEKLTADEVAKSWVLLKDADANIRRGAAVFLLGHFDPANSDQAAAFTALLGDTDAMVRARGLDAAKQLDSASQVLILAQLAKLVELQNEPRSENRAAAIRLCGVLKRYAAASLPALKQSAAGDPDGKVRSAALVAIVQVAETAEAVALLAPGLADNDPAVRLVAAARLRQLGPLAAPATRQLVATLADTNQAAAEAAAEALIRIGPATVEPLAEQLTSPSISARKLALACLAKLGPAAKPAIPSIEQCKQDSDAEVRKLAEAALKRISP